MLLNDHKARGLRGIVVRDDLTCRARRARVRSSSPKSVTPVPQRYFLAILSGRVERSPRITSARRFKEVVTQGRQVVVGRFARVF